MSCLIISERLSLLREKRRRQFGATNNCQVAIQYGVLTRTSDVAVCTNSLVCDDDSDCVLVTLFYHFQLATLQTKRPNSALDKGLYHPKPSSHCCKGQSWSNIQLGPIEWGWPGSERSLSMWRSMSAMRTKLLFTAETESLQFEPPKKRRVQHEKEALCNAYWELLDFSKSEDE